MDLCASPVHAAEVQPALSDEPSLFERYRSGAKDLILKGLELTGIKYRRGGTDADSGLDCSGFVQLVFKDALGMGLAEAVMPLVPMLTARLHKPITLENGDEYQGALEPGAGDGSQAYEVDGKFVATASITIPADLPMGYHTLHVSVGDRTQDATLISAPERIPMLPAMEHDQLWGWMAQLYSIRSSNSWGVGDYEDLKTMLVDAKQKTGADFVLINPVHAAEPVSPLTPSPYLPVSRRLINFTYIRPEAIAEYATLSEGDKNAVDGLHADTEPLNGDSQLIDRDAMWRSKMHALWIIFKAGRTAERQSVFDQFKADCGSDLEAYATWCLCYDKWGAPNGEESNWERKFNRNSPEIANLRKQYPDTLDFYRWLEWIAAEQLSSAQQAAKDAGMHIGIMSDMAVGVHPSGADVWWNPERFAKTRRVNPLVSHLARKRANLIPAEYGDTFDDAVKDSQLHLTKRKRTAFNYALEIR